MRNQFRGMGGMALILMLLISAMPAFGQQPAPNRGQIERERITGGEVTPLPERDTFERRIALPGRGGPVAGDFLFLATEMSFGGKLVKGAPYSAQAVTESTQTLTDGNRIVNKSIAALYRDSEGRTRREQTLKSIGPFARGGEPAQTIFINDPVAGTSYTLDPKSLTARKMPPMRFKVQGGIGGSDHIKRGDPAAPDVGYGTGQQQIVLERSPEPSNNNRIAIDVDAQSKRRIEAGTSMDWLEARNPSAAKSESLGKQNINGVEAEGKRTTVTIAAGEIGNELPIEIVSERWYSPELQVIVMTRHSDPRFGQTSYQLTDINRGEPARELFEVPAGYKIEEPPAPFAVGQPEPGIRGGALNGKAIMLPRPEYPEVAKAAKASGTVSVQITIDEEGNVISATAVSGHPLLRAAAVNAAREAKFSPTKLNGQPVKVSGMLTYNFVAQ